MERHTASPHTLEVPRTARWWSLSPSGNVPVRGTLFVLHGYGQLAEYFIRKFQRQADEGWHIVAPEGGHRFYLKGTSGRVGASWMTKEERLSDIADHVRFLDLVRVQCPFSGSGPQVLLGFSQGVATALRWVAQGQFKPSEWTGLLAHSGVIPPDLSDTDSRFHSAPALQLITGHADPYIQDPELRFQTAESAWKQAGGQPDNVVHHGFEGGHDIDPDTVSRILSTIH